MLLLIAILMPQPSNGQQVMAAFTGKVTDPSGVAVPDAKVTAMDNERGTVWTTTTNSDGIYDLPQVPIGKYNVKVAHPGFQGAQQASVTLVLNQIAKIDFGSRWAMSHHGRSFLRGSSAADREHRSGHHHGSARHRSLPLETRNYNQLALLRPGR